MSSGWPSCLSGQLWESADSPEVDPDRFSVVVGTGLGGAERIVESYDLMNEGGPRKVSPLAVQMIMPNGAAAVVGLQLGARAGVITPVSACSSGSEAIAHGWRQIVMGDADVAVCGGVEGPIEALPIAAFSMMRAMSTRNDEPERASRPFDKDRDGFVFGEAGALMLIETEEHAKARGATPLARLMGAGITSDAFHMVAPAADGVRAGRAMTRSLELAGLSPKDIDHVNAHGTATPIGDSAEANAIRVAGCEHAAVYAPKSRAGSLDRRSRGARVGAHGAEPAGWSHPAHAPETRNQPRCRRGRTSLRRIPLRDQQLVRVRRPQCGARLRALLTSTEGSFATPMTELVTGKAFPNVVVTGIAMTTALATDAENTWKLLLDCQSGIRTLDDPFVEEYDLPVRIGGHLLEEFDQQLTRIELRRTGYLQRMSTILGRRVWENTGSPRSTPTACWCRSAPAWARPKSSSSAIRTCTCAGTGRSPR